MYKRPMIVSFDSRRLLEQIGPMQAASVNIEIGAVAYNNPQPNEVRHVDNAYEHKLVRLKLYDGNKLV